MGKPLGKNRRWRHECVVVLFNFQILWYLVTNENLNRPCRSMVKPVSFHKHRWENIIRALIRKFEHKNGNHQYEFLHLFKKCVQLTVVRLDKKDVRNFPFSQIVWASERIENMFIVRSCLEVCPLAFWHSISGSFRCRRKNVLCVLEEVAIWHSIWLLWNEKRSFR